MSWIGVRKPYNQSRSITCEFGVDQRKSEVLHLMAKLTSHGNVTVTNSFDLEHVSFLGQRVKRIIDLLEKSKNLGGITRTRPSRESVNEFGWTSIKR